MAISGEIDPAFHRFNAQAYNEHHYAKTGRADLQVAAKLIGDMALCLGSRMRTFESLYEIGSGGTLRTPALGEPLLAPNAQVTLTDISDSQIATVHSQVKSVRQGASEVWDGHEEAMGEANPLWRGAITNLCRRDITVGYHNIRETEVPPTDLRMEGHTLCSNTNRPELYEHTLDNFVRTMGPGDIAIRLFDVKSTEYFVEGQRFEGYPIDEQIVRSEAESRGLTVLSSCEFLVEVPAEEKRTRSTLSALGGAVLLKPVTATIIA